MLAGSVGSRPAASWVLKRESCCLLKSGHLADNIAGNLCRFLQLIFESEISGSEIINSPMLCFMHPPGMCRGARRGHCVPTARRMVWPRRSIINKTSREQRPGRWAPATAKARVTVETQETRRPTPPGAGTAFSSTRGRHSPRAGPAARPHSGCADDPRGALRPLA